MVGECWLWAKTTKDDYPMMWIPGTGGKRFRAHRVIYEALVGPIPEGLTLDHLCRIKRCVNPDHLEPVTHAENVRRGNSGKYQASKTHCPQGHEYTPENTHIGRRGKYIMRGCRTCRNTARREKRHEIKLLRA